MPDTKISALTDGAPGVSTDTIPIVRASANRRLTLSDLPISTAVQAALDGKAPVLFDLVDPAVSGGLPTQSALGKSIAYRQTTATAIYSGGFLTAATGSGSGGRAWYAEMNFPAGATRLGCKFKFTAGSGGYNGCAVLILWETSLVDSVSIPRTACHITFTRYGWTVGKITTVGGSLVTYGYGAYRSTLAVDTVYSAEIAVEDGTLYIMVPDGTTVTLRDPALSSIVGYFPSWELFQANQSTDDIVAIGQVWAAGGSQKQIGTGAAAAGAVDAARRPTGLTLTSVASSAIPTTSALIDAAAVCPIVGGAKSGKTLCTLSVWVSMAANQVLLFQLQIRDLTGIQFGVNRLAYQTLGVPYYGYVTMTFVQDNIVSSLPMSAEFWIWSTATGNTVEVSAGQPLTMAFVPLD